MPYGCNPDFSLYSKVFPQVQGKSWLQSSKLLKSVRHQCRHCVLNFRNRVLDCLDMVLHSKTQNINLKHNEIYFRHC
ncbi:hypothetical protein HanXRQr2_Chr17g0784251 [Helianthus annuus]|uniref:Uncharacterized protein n=1 Tax=Helianthus annuus TaxID=4232 RepID=A0A9K3DGW9_HELAN|nr:hypothetical protein HanXRQr2_Chr17g0784251 [Helianthus annuus]